MNPIFIKFNDIDGNSYTIQLSEILMITNRGNNIEVITMFDEGIPIDNETYKSIDDALDKNKLLI
jgi:hypothetical protein